MYDKTTKENDKILEEVLNKVNKKSFVIIGIMLLMLLVICGCSSTESAKNQAGAYFTLFETLYETDPALHSNCIYLAVDLSKVKLSDTKPLKELFKDFCEENEYTLLLDTIDGLREKGYVVDLRFPDGFVIIFDDTQLDENTIVTNAMKWRSGLGAVGAEYTLKRKDFTWEITKTAKAWIS